MLKSIYIRNYALIDTLEINFEKGFSVITGETGAGKSIILGAIGLLLGQRADIKTIKNPATKCIIEASFDISAYSMDKFFTLHELEYDPYECILRRELQSSGKSRAFINDSPVSLSVIKELGEHLIDIHSQHQNLLLSNESFQLNVLDIVAHDQPEANTYKQIFFQYRNTLNELKHLRESAQKNKADEDYIRFQLEQLEEANLKEGEQEELEQEAETLSHTEEIKSCFYKAGILFSADEKNLLSVLKESIENMQSIKKVYPPAGDLAERLHTNYVDLKDISHEINIRQENIEFSPERLNEVNERLNLFYSLEQKHHVSGYQDLIALTQTYRRRLNEITSSDDRIAELVIRKETQYKEVQQAAFLLTQKRTAAGKEIEKEMKERLTLLGMPHARFKVELTPKKEPDPNGLDNVAFVFSANKNGTLQNISTVASGGEIARVMLSIKALIASATQLPTIIFDEIDTGVSGEMANKMASIMEEMGRYMQVISITHLPQIASRGSIHYKVFKQDNEKDTSSNIRRLGPQERIEEIAHMLSGASLTNAAIDNAKELLKNKYGKE